jgi:hypothetical protein
MKRFFSAIFTSETAACFTFGWLFFGGIFSDAGAIIGGIACAAIGARDAMRRNLEPR